MVHRIGYEQAIRNHDLQEVRRLFDRADLESDDYNGTLLHYAARRGTVEIVQFFVENGAEIDRPGGVLEAPAITYAAGNGKLDIVRHLFESGAILGSRPFLRETPSSASWLRGFGEWDQVIEP